MLSLQRFLSKSDRFYDLLEASAEEAGRAADALMEVLAGPQDQVSLDEFILRRRQNKRIAEDLTALLCSTFVTPLEREDIESLSRALYKIPKTIEKFGERLLLSRALVRGETFAKQARLLKQATDTVGRMVRQLRHKPNLDRIKEENDRLHHYEGEADKIIIELLRDLYSGQYEPLQVIVLRDLFELLEKVIDRCRDAGNVVFQIVLKNSLRKPPMTLVLCVILAGLVFEYINGFHDTANAIATVVSTRVLSPRQAVMMAAACNLLGALLGTAVATTIGTGLVESGGVELPTMLAALLAAIAWNIFTWWLGLPSSSSHALIGGLCGAAVAAAGGDFGVVKWYEIDADGKAIGLWPKVVLPMIASPIFGFIIGFAIMGLLLRLLRNWRPHRVTVVFGRLQLISAAMMGVSHGTNDAQKTMGVIALTLFTATSGGVFDNLPWWLGFLQTPEFDVATWVKVICALTMAAGTAAGGWRIIRTLGHRMVRLQPIHGFAAETTAATVIHLATHWGIPLSTTHVISTSIMGVGATRGLGAVKWGVVERMIWAWVLTIPATAALGYALDQVLRAVV